MRNLELLVVLIAMALWSIIAQTAEPRADRSLPWVTSETRAPRVAMRTFESKLVGTKVSYHIYTPAAYAESKTRWPVLYWLHGTDGGIVGIPPMAKLFDDAITAGKIPPMLVVFVNGLPRRLWADSKDGSAPVESVFITEVIPDVDQTFRTIATRDGRILEGFSMGGYGAARLGFKYPELFAGISILAGGPLDLEFQGPRARQNPRLRELILRDVCQSDLKYFQAISPWTMAETAAPALSEKKLLIRHVIGERDDTRDLNRQFHERLTKLKIAHDYIEVPKVGHEAPGLFTAINDGQGKFYRQALGLPDVERPK